MVISRDAEIALEKVNVTLIVQGKKTRNKKGPFQNDKTNLYKNSQLNHM